MEGRTQASIPFICANTAEMGQTIMPTVQRRQPALGEAETGQLVRALELSSACAVSKKRPGADCGSDHELLIAKLRLKLKKVGKTIRPFMYDLN